VLDGILFEKRGVPAAVICTEPFITSGKAMAVAQGITDYPFVVIPHPIAATDHQVLSNRVNKVLEQIEGLMVD
jgi:hypothetical protein